MKYILWATLAFGVIPAHADDPVPMPTQPDTAPAPVSEADAMPRTHIDQTVVGDAVPDNASAPAPNLDNDHNFVEGAPNILAVTKRLHLSASQETKVKGAIESADAGAAVLIKREHAVREMVAATTPQDPMYSKLILEQSSQDSRWTDNREALRTEVLKLLTPAQRTRFEELMPAH